MSRCLCIFRFSMFEIILFVKHCCFKLTSLCYNISLIKFKLATKLIADNLNMKIHGTNAWTLDLKKQKTSFLKKTQQQSYIFLKSQGCNKEQLSLQCCEKMTLQIDLLRSIHRLCCRGIIGIKYFLSCLLQNNLLGVKMLFEIQKLQVFYSKQHFDTLEVILQQKQHICFISYVEYRGANVQDALMLMRSI